MGFEYKIIAKFTDKQTSEIVDLFKQDKRFDKRLDRDGRTFWEFKSARGQGPMPNVAMTFESDGLYVCQYSSSYLWTDLDKLKNYLTTEEIAHKILDYSD